MSKFLRSLFADASAFVPEAVGSILAATRGEPESPASQFSSWLPYRATIPQEDVFVNNGTLGFLLEVMPQSGADERMVEVLTSVYAACPPMTGVQFHLFASPQVHPALVSYARQRAEDIDIDARSTARGRTERSGNLYRLLARQRVGYLLAGANRSLTKGYHFTVRDFRLLVSVTLPGTADDERRIEELLALRASISTTLKAALFPNAVRGPADLINWCTPFLNADRLDNPHLPLLHYDDGRDIRDQIVDFDTEQKAHVHGLTLTKVGTDKTMEMRFLSIKSFPESFPLWSMGALIGDIMQPALQYTCPFLITMGVHVLDQNTSKTQVTANHIRATQNAGSKMAKIMPDTERKLKDWTVTAQSLDAGGGLVSMYHQLALFIPRASGETNEVYKARTGQAVETAKSIWRARGFELNSDVYMARQSLLASLPMTLSPAFHADMKKTRRVTRKLSTNAIHLAPVLAEWKGTRTPTLQLVGRRGQLVGVDLFDNEGNYNAAIVGVSGSGKSVLMNEIASAYRGIGAKVFMMDLGRSFEKLCQKARGTHIEFRPDTRINVNPFSAVNDIDEDIDMLVPALAKMCSMASKLDEVQYKAISAMVLKCFRQYGNDMTVTALRDAFVPGTIAELGLQGDQRIKDLAVMLNPYSKGGQYERFFEGRNTVDFSNDFIVIENEELKRKPDLHAVVNILLLYQITGTMYLSRDRKKLLMIDELKQQLGDIGSDDPVKAAVVEEAARRARKYGGSLITATQDADDYYSSAQMTAAFNCSDWLFLMRQKDTSLELLDRNGKLKLDAGRKRLLSSMRTEPGVYSEVYVSSPMGESVLRLCLDPATNLLFSNKLEDNKPIDELRQKGHSIDDAIAIVLRSRGLA